MLLLLLLTISLVEFEQSAFELFNLFNFEMKLLRVVREKPTEILQLKV